MTAEIAALLVALGCNGQIATDATGRPAAVIWVCPVPAQMQPSQQPQPQPRPQMQMQRRG